MTSQPQTDADLPWTVSAPQQTLDWTVSAADLDGFHHTNNVVYLQWLERVAWAHSQALGLGLEAYEQLGCGCVARRHELDYLAPTFEGDELVVGTWVAESDFRLTMWRGYQIIRRSDRRTVLTGRTQWVCVDMRTGRPRRMPPAFVDGYKPVAVTPAGAAQTRAS
ncbi:acyl-CoA thioesterase [Flagellatimonas centrodinii]|uniref:acyl-CoA thioesterase n=1 Tax=Flagellatimonas centrodinii TaxID=2806210 RepID=UPI001FEE379D|nr:thioesterase family protein [Flagellatimonas centrodinii]ULQ46159.1 acyl-CoA thioesterase [Flagellatimonas centrodinii]